MLPSAPATGANLRFRAGDQVLPVGLTNYRVWAIVLLGAVLRLVGLGHRSFWLDEIASVVIARLPASVFWAKLWHDEGNMSLYYVALRPWVTLGVSEAWVRLLSAIAGIAAVPLMYLLARRLFSTATAFVAALFFAMSGCAIWASQEARGYSFLTLGAVASTYFLVRLIEEPGYGIAVAYGVVAGLTFYCHYYGTLVPVAHAVSLLALPARYRPWKQLSLAGLIVAAFSLPVLWMIHTQDVSHLAWVPRISWLEFYHLGVFLAGGGGKAFGALLLVLELALVVLFLRTFRLAWRDRERYLRRWAFAVVLSCFASPMIIALIASLVRPLFYHRFLIICLPAWILMVATGAQDIPRRNWRGMAVAGVCALSLACVVVLYRHVTEDWRGAVRYVMAEARPGDRILYYQPDGYFAAESYRDWLEGKHAPRPQGIIADWPAQSWTSHIDHAGRVWLVLYRANVGDGPERAIDSQLRSGYTETRQVDFRAITLVEYSARR